jgi:transposase-like protein
MSANEVISTGRRRRRRHSELFKAEAVGACQQEGVSIAAVALARGLNANLLRSWVRKAERGNAPIAIGRSAAADPVQRAQSFVPVTLPTDGAERPIRVQLCRKGRKVSIEWPASAAHECARLLRELMK